MIAVAVGGALGLCVGAGLFFARLHFAKVDKFLGYMAPALVAVVALLIGITCLLALRSGSEGVTAGLVGLLFLGIGVLVLGLAIILPASIQAPRLGKTRGATMLAVMLEPLLLGAFVWAFQVNVTVPRQRQVVDAYWQQELAHRKRLQSLDTAVPDRYKTYTPEVLDMDAWNRRQVELRGGSVPSMVPPVVEGNLRSLWAAQAEPTPQLDREAYSEAAATRTRFTYGLVGGWLAGAVLVPLAIRPRRHAVDSSV
ncbi:MAG: hypothetical protein H6534_02780 [Chthonomonadaceae bacterium]|nr:hypothetical protein [Chthonomonadaceae bacterium]